jgi:hypothetical protein
MTNNTDTHTITFDIAPTISLIGRYIKSARDQEERITSLLRQEAEAKTKALSEDDIRDLETIRTRCRGEIQGLNVAYQELAAIRDSHPAA